MASFGGVTVAAAAERGVGAGSDLAVRPTRIVAVGDATFAMNGPLAARANANRDFFLNCIAFLSGTDSGGSSGTGADVLEFDMDRAARQRHLVCSVFVVPGMVFVFMVLSSLLMRRRS